MAYFFPVETRPTQRLGATEWSPGSLGLWLWAFHLTFEWYQIASVCALQKYGRATRCFSRHSGPKCRQTIWGHCWTLSVSSKSCSLGQRCMIWRLGHSLLRDAKPSNHFARLGVCCHMLPCSLIHRKKWTFSWAELDVGWYYVDALSVTKHKPMSLWCPGLGWSVSPVLAQAAGLPYFGLLVAWTSISNYFKYIMFNAHEVAGFNHVQPHGHNDSPKVHSLRSVCSCDQLHSESVTSRGIASHPWAFFAPECTWQLQELGDISYHPTQNTTRSSSAYTTI